MKEDIQAIIDRMKKVVYEDLEVTIDNAFDVQYVKR